MLQATSNSCSAKCDLPCSSQQKVDWTLKTVAALFFPSNNQFSSCHCFEHLFFLGSFALTRSVGAKACNGSYWHLLGPKTPTKLPSLLRLTRTRNFSYLMSAHRGSWLKDFCGGSKIEQFYLYFCTHKIQLTVVSHTQRGKALVAEAAKGDVNLSHVPEPWCCYRTVPAHTTPLPSQLEHICSFTVSL